MSTAPPESDEIRRRMAQIRRDLHEDVRGVVEGAEAATDWRRFIRNYPWASMGVALLAGYLIVPRKHRPTTTVVQVGPTEAARPAPVERLVAEEPRKPKGKGWIGSLFGLVAPMAFRAVQGYALQYAEQWMAQKMAKQMELHPELAAMLAGQGPGGQGPPNRPPTGPGPRVAPPGAPRF